MMVNSVSKIMHMLTFCRKECTRGWQALSRDARVQSSSFSSEVPVSNVQERVLLQISANTSSLSKQLSALYVWQE